MPDVIDNPSQPGQQPVHAERLEIVLEQHASRGMAHDDFDFIAVSGWGEIGERCPQPPEPAAICRPRPCRELEDAFAVVPLRNGLWAKPGALGEPCPLHRNVIQRIIPRLTPLFAVGLDAKQRQPRRSQKNPIIICRVRRGGAAIAFQPFGAFWVDGDEPADLAGLSAAVVDQSGIQIQNLEGQVRNIAVVQSPVDAKANPGPLLEAGVLEQGSQLRGGEGLSLPKPQIAIGLDIGADEIPSKAGHGGDMLLSLTPAKECGDVGDVPAQRRRRSLSKQLGKGGEARGTDGCQITIRPNRSSEDPQRADVILSSPLAHSLGLSGGNPMIQVVAILPDAFPQGDCPPTADALGYFGNVPVDLSLFIGPPVLDILKGNGSAAYVDRAPLVPACPPILVGGERGEYVFKGAWDDRRPAHGAACYPFGKPWQLTGVIQAGNIGSMRDNVKPEVYSESASEAETESVSGSKAGGLLEPGTVAQTRKRGPKVPAVRNAGEVGAGAAMRRGKANGAGVAHLGLPLGGGRNATKPPEIPEVAEDSSNGLKIHVSPVQSRPCPVASDTLETLETQANEPVSSAPPPVPANLSKDAHKCLTDEPAHWGSIGGDPLIALESLQAAVSHYLNNSCDSRYTSASVRAQVEMEGIRKVLGTVEKNAKEVQRFMGELRKDAEFLDKIAGGLAAHINDSLLKARLVSIEYESDGAFVMWVEISENVWKSEVEPYRLCIRFQDGRWRAPLLVSAVDISSRTGFSQDFLSGIVAASSLLQDAWDKLEHARRACDKECAEQRQKAYDLIDDERGDLHEFYRAGRHGILKKWREDSAPLAPKDVPECLKRVRHLREYGIVASLPCYVYFLIHENEVVYVGQSLGIDERLSTHRKDKLFDRVLVLECDRRSLNAVESRFIKQLTPKYNKALNPSFNRPKRRRIPAPSGERGPR